MPCLYARSNAANGKEVIGHNVLAVSAYAGARGRFSEESGFSGQTGESVNRFYLIRNTDRAH